MDLDVAFKLRENQLHIDELSRGQRLESEKAKADAILEDEQDNAQDLVRKLELSKVKQSQ